MGVQLACGVRSLRSFAILAKIDLGLLGGAGDLVSTSRVTLKPKP